MFNLQQILLCGILYWLAEANLPFITLWTLQKPLVCGWAAGLVLGAPVRGAACGAILSVILLGFSSAGSSMSVDLALAGITGAALTSAGWTPYAAVLPALLAGSAGKYIWKLRMRVNVHFARRVRTLLEEGKTGEILLPALVLPALFAALVCLPVCACLLFWCNAFPRDANFAEGILTAAAGLLPAGGIALALAAAGHGTFFSKKAVLGSLKNSASPEKTDETETDEWDPDAADPDEEEPGIDDTAGIEDHIDLDPDEGDLNIADRAYKGAQCSRKATAIRLPQAVLLEAALLWLMLLHICYNNEWMMGQAMAVVFLPLARRLRPRDPEGQRMILLRQSRYFNTHCECGACIPGLMAAMEEELALARGGISLPPASVRDTDRNIPRDMDRINRILMVRTSLMGVCGALGDTLFQKHLIPLLLMAGCLLSAVWPQYPAGPVLYTLLMTILSLTIGLRSFFAGYHSEPEQVLQTLEKNVFRRAESIMAVFLALLALPAAARFVRFPLSGGEPAVSGLTGSLAGTLLIGNTEQILESVAALLLTAVCFLCIRKLHWKKRRLYSILSIAGIAIYLICG